MGSDPDILVDLTTARTEFEAETIVQALEAQGIPARSFANVGTVMQWDIASTQPIKVAVRRRDLERAAGALRAIRADSVDIAWDELDPGEPQETEDARPRAPISRAWGLSVTCGGVLLVAVGLALGDGGLGSAEVRLIAFGLIGVWAGLLLLWGARPRPKR